MEIQKILHFDIVECLWNGENDDKPLDFEGPDSSTQTHIRMRQFYHWK